MWQKARQILKDGSKQEVSDSYAGSYAKRSKVKENGSIY
jgi:hypothetical protein